jgi:hypothetical protein
MGRPESKKKEYNPRPYDRKDSKGIIVPQRVRAETAARYPATEQWGNTKQSKPVRFTDATLNCKPQVPNASRSRF